MTRARALVVLSAVCTLAACRTAWRPRSTRIGRTTRAKLEDVPVKGFWVIVDYGPTAASSTTEVEGELLAVGPKAVYVDQAAGDPERIPRRWIRSVLVKLYDAYAWAYALTGSLLGVSAISHGYYMVFSIPTWAIVTTAVSIEAARSNDMAVPLDKLGELYQYARYPAGWPPTLRGRHRRDQRTRTRGRPTSQPSASQPNASQPASRPSASQPASRPSGPAADEPGAPWLKQPDKRPRLRQPDWLED